MAQTVFDRETLLDLTVNVIPLAMMAFFLVLFLAVNPFATDAFGLALQVGLIVAPFVLLAILTYYSGKAIATAEREAEAADAE